jgi:pimeloyl-ACP methyl ester carboxylesterase
MGLAKQNLANEVKSVISSFHRVNAAHKTVHTLFSSLAVVIAGFALLVPLPGHAQCSMAGQWEGSWNGVTGQGAATSGSISASFTQTGSAFSGSLTLDGNVIPSISGTNSGGISTSFGNPHNPDGPTVSATGSFNSTCNVLEGNYTQTGSMPSNSASGTYTITTKTDVTLLDPIPTLASGFGPSFAIDSNPSDISTGGTPVTGIAADGVANLIIRIANLPTSASQVTINVFNDQGVLSTDVTQDGGLAPTGSPSYTATTSMPSASLTVNTQQEGGSNMAFAVYVPPIDYARLAFASDQGTLSRQVTLQVLDSDGNQLVTPQTTITVFRPPIFFVHGFWGAPATWNQFIAGLKLPVTTQQSGLQSCVADYESTNGDSVDDNTEIVLPQAFRCLMDFKKSQNAAAAQLDFIVHSMGGLIANNMPKYPALFQGVATYGQGYIHKLITIDTPYYGSPLALYLGEAYPNCKEWLDFEGLFVGGAVTDLTPNSAFLTGLYPLPSAYPKHAISGQLSADQVVSANIAVSRFFTLDPYNPCISVFSIPGVTQPQDFNFTAYYGATDPTYGGANDMIVSVYSQLGPLQNYSNSITGYSHSPAIVKLPPFFTVIDIPGVLDLVSPNPGTAVQLLNDQVSNPEFLH